jgi:hypothetical protein
MKGIRTLAVAMFAVGALLIPSATASASGGIVADTYPTILEAESIGPLKAMIGSSGDVLCELEPWEGELAGPSATYGLAGGGTCNFGGHGGPIEMNGCRFEFDPATQTTAVGPPGCGRIDMHLVTCEIEIVPQTGLSSAVQSNVSNGDVQIALEASGVEYYLPEEAGGCGQKKGYNKNLKLTGGFYVAGYKSEWGWSGPPTDLKVITNGALPVGAFMQSGNYAAQAYPVRYQAAPAPTGQLNIISLTPNIINVTCGAAGTGKLEAASSTLKFTEFSNCMAGGQPATVKSNSCSYQFTTQVSVACTAENDKIQIETTNCTITIAAQSFTGSAFTPSNAGEGYDATVGLNSTATGIKVGKERTKESQPKLGCLTFPTGEKGTFAANVNLSGTYAG